MKAIDDSYLRHRLWQLSAEPKVEDTSADSVPGGPHFIHSFDPLGILKVDFIHRTL